MNRELKYIYNYLYVFIKFYKLYATERYSTLLYEEQQNEKLEFIHKTSNQIVKLISLNKLNPYNSKIKIMEVCILYKQLYEEDIVKTYQKIHDMIYRFPFNSTDAYSSDESFDTVINFKSKNCILNYLLNQYQNVSIGDGYYGNISQYITFKRDTIKNHFNKITYDYDENKINNKMSIFLIFKSSMIILIIILVYSIFPRPFLNIDIALLCIVLMIGVNWIQRLYYGEKPIISDYYYFWNYLAGGVYALLPIDLVPDIIPFIGSLDDVIVVWFLTFYCLIADR